MKKTLFFLLLIFLILKLSAQDYLISFAGTGAASTVDTVHVKNITQGTSIILEGSDILHLTSAVGIKQPAEGNDHAVRIYPNPMNTASTIEVDVPVEGLLTLEIYDLSGKKALSIQNDLQAGVHVYNVSHLRAGIYTIRIASGDFKYSGKIISNGSTGQMALISYAGSFGSPKGTFFKSLQEVIPMAYDDGDLLHFRGISGDFVTIMALIPTSSTTVTFNFVEATDADGNNYGTITLGSQTWMIENLKTTTFNDGEAITEWTPGDDWYYDPDPVAYYQWADTDDLNQLYEEELPFDFYGAIYNEASLASGKLAPQGWRIPTEQDFIELENFLSANGQAGNEATALKSYYGWVVSSGNGTDLYGFNGLPNGYVSGLGTATGAQVICAWATSDNPTPQTRRIAHLYDENSVLYFDNSIQLGAGIRCIKE